MQTNGQVTQFHWALNRLIRRKPSTSLALYIQFICSVQNGLQVTEEQEFNEKIQAMKKQYDSRIKQGLQ
jgi:hypothetical protein